MFWNPAPLNADSASETCWFITFGTLAPPGETVMVTVEPWLASVNAAGFCLTTVFGGAVEFWSVTSLTWNPLFTSVFRALRWRS